MIQTVVPVEGLSGALTVPGSKSHTIRALIIASLADGESTIHAPLDSADTRSCITVCRALGAEITEEKELWRNFGHRRQTFAAARRDRRGQFRHIPLPRRGDCGAGRWDYPADRGRTNSNPSDPAAPRRPYRSRCRRRVGQQERLCAGIDTRPPQGRGKPASSAPPASTSRASF